MDINAPRRAKRQGRGTGLSKPELEKLAAQERKLYEGLGQKEPDNFASGDMTKSLEGSDDAAEEQ